MAQRTRPGAWMRVWTNFTEAFQKRTRTVVGKDYLGNVYYEETPRAAPSAHHFRSKAVARGFEAPPGGDPRDVPVEWESWLKGTRTEPPTEEEMARSAARQEAIQQSLIDSQTEKRAPTVSAEGPAPGDSQHRAFPKYKDFEPRAGSKGDGSRTPS